MHQAGRHRLRLEGPAHAAGRDRAASLERTRSSRERKRAEAALRESQAQFQTIVESAIDAIISVDEEEHIVLFNGAAQKMFRCSLAQAMGVPIRQFIPEKEGRRGRLRAFWRWMPTGWRKSLGATAGNCAGGGRMAKNFPWKRRCRRALSERAGLFTIILRDVTERKLAERELSRKGGGTGRSNSDLEQFAYVASHDLQEPLRMVAAYTQLLGERYKGKLDENADKYINYATEGRQADADPDPGPACVLASRTQGHRRRNGVTATWR